MIGLSTAWLSEMAQDVEQWLAMLQELGVTCLELEYRVPEGFFAKLKPRLQEQDVRVLSVHNFFPFPDEYTCLSPSGDLFLLSSLDREEREKAVRQTRKTIQAAHDLGCSAVVLHLGKVEMDSRFSEFCRFFEYQEIGSAKMQEFLADIESERKKKHRRFLDAVCFSLDALAREAERRNVRLGVENRYYFHEIPNLEELGIILERFRGAPLLHWHDVGHGFVQEQLGMQLHKELLEKYGERLLGVHLHDAEGYADHQALGSGKVDFGWLKQYVRKEAIKIVEVHPHVEAEDVRKGFSFLRDLGYE